MAKKKKKDENWTVLVRGDHIDAETFKNNPTSKKEALEYGKQVAQDCYDNGDDDVEIFVIRVAARITVQPTYEVEEY